MFYAGFLSGAKVAIEIEHYPRKERTKIQLATQLSAIGKRMGSGALFFLHFWNDENKRAVTD